MPFTFSTLGKLSLPETFLGVSPVGATHAPGLAGQLLQEAPHPSPALGSSCRELCSLSSQRLLSLQGWPRPDELRLPAPGSFQLLRKPLSNGRESAVEGGTNRQKTIDEITAESVTIQGIDALRSRLSQLARNETVVWLNPQSRTPSRFAYPDSQTLEYLVKSCRSVDVSLVVPEKGLFGANSEPEGH